MIYLVGMGPGHIKYLTGIAIDTIRNADHVIAFGRIAKTARQLRPDVLSVSRLSEIIALTGQEGTTAILASGDAGFYGILDYLIKNDIKIKEVIPGISSFQYLMNKLQKSWQNASLFSLHGRDENLAEMIHSKLAVVLTDNQNSPGSISSRLFAQGARGNIYAGFNLSYDDELIVKKEIGEMFETNLTLSTVVVEIETVV